MKKILLLFHFLTFSSFVVLSQGRSWNWAFGDSAGVSFATGQPVFFQSVISTYETSASISDEQGNLLFYAGADDAFNPNGKIFVWDRLNNLMPNGTNLYGYSSSSQGSLILPYPNDSSQYFIFHFGYFPWGLFYSIVNMNLNGGYGAVTQKNMLVCDSVLSEKMCAIKHGNGRDWWVITHKYNSADFYKFIVSVNGIILGPYIQTIGDSLGYTLDEGQMVLNEEGTKIAFANQDGGQLDVFDFDRCSGLLSNPVLLGDPPYTNPAPLYYGCSFSPSSSVFYASTVDSLFQFNLNAPNVKASKTLLSAAGSNPSTVLIGAHLLAPDRKIYVAITDEVASYCDSLTRYLSVINDPNQLGTACNFVPYSFPLQNCARVKGGLPNMANYNLGIMGGSVCDTVTAVTELKPKAQLQINPNPAHDYIRVSYDLGDNASGTIQFINTDGRVELENILTESNAEKEIKINSLNSGVYQVVIKSDQGIVVQKRIVVI